MSTGDQQDVFSRLKRWLPPWFGQARQPTPVLDALLQGAASPFSFVYSLFVYAKQQTRISTATDGWLDLIALDFFGLKIRRAKNQTDASFRARILANLVRERGTRNAVVNVVTALTGQAPTIFEPLRPADTGAYRTGALGYGVAGGYGSFAMPYQAFVTARRPASQGIPNVTGYGRLAGGYQRPSQIKYASMSDIDGVTDADIYAAIDSVRPIGVTLWVRLQP